MTHTDAISDVTHDRETADAAASAHCRFCGAHLQYTFVDLGMSPLCESYVSRDQLNGMEAFYPLHVYACDRCFLVQLQEYVDPAAIFTEYAYFSSYSDAWLEHARSYVDLVTQRFGLDERSSVVEVASNDGYLLRNFVARGIPVLGIEPAANVARVAVEQGVATRVAFFGRALAQQLAAERGHADLIVGNNVLAQVPDLNDFVAGLGILLGRTGVITIEFPHLVRLMRENQFDTIYHEHFSYFSLLSVETIFAAHDLVIFDVDELPTHGGSLRIYARHSGDGSQPVSHRVGALRAREIAEGLTDMRSYTRFGEQVARTKWALLELLIDLRRRGKSVAGYGAPGKGNTLLNYCGIRTDLIEYTVDRNPYKQGKFTPGTHIPIYGPERIFETKPDYVLILPWNLKDEIVTQLAAVRDWGGQFIIPIPTARVLAGG
jgi:C-methyltransferase-like protein/putative zinc binding protein/methyltransferase family protein